MKSITFIIAIVSGLIMGKTAMLFWEANNEPMVWFIAMLWVFKWHIISFIFTAQSNKDKKEQ